MHMHMQTMHNHVQQDALELKYAAMLQLDLLLCCTTIPGCHIGGHSTPIAAACNNGPPMLQPLSQSIARPLPAAAAFTSCDAVPSNEEADTTTEPRVGLKASQFGVSHVCVQADAVIYASTGTFCTPTHHHLFCFTTRPYSSW